MSPLSRTWRCRAVLLPALLSLTLTVSAHERPGDAAATAPDGVAEPTCAQATLCARLGGPQAVRDIASELLARAVADPRTQAHWDRVDMKRVRIKLGEYLCVLTGGTCVFDDDDIKTIHAGQHVREAEFYALVENLRLVLDSRGVAAREKNELLALLAPSKRDVVEP